MTDGEAGAEVGQKVQVRDKPVIAWTLPFEVAEPAPLEELPFGAKHLRNYDRPTLIRKILHESAENNWTPSLREAKALICIFARDFYRAREPESVQKKPSAWVGEDLPWPPEAVLSPQPLFDGKGYEDEKGKVVVRDSSLGMISDSMDEHLEQNGLHTVLKPAIARMSQENLAQMGKYVLDNLGAFDEFLLESERATGEFFDLMFSGLDWTGEPALELGGQIIDFLQENISPRAVFLNKTPQEVGDARKHEHLYQLTSRGRQRLIYRALASGRYNTETRDAVLGLVLRRTHAIHSFPEELNVLREMTGEASLDQTERGKVGDLLRDLLVLTGDLPVHAKLDEIYKAIQFEKYELNELTREARIASLKEVFRRHEVVNDARVFDNGCGTGWVVGDLREAGFTNVRGVDYSKRNVQVAKEEFGDYFMVGDWYHLPVEDASQDVLMNLTRGKTHTENEDKFRAALREDRRVMKDRALGVFDMPDPTKGGYWKNVQKYRAAMKQFGFTDEELKDFWYIVDSPDRENFYNRFVPPREWVEEELAVRGFTLLEVREEGIPTGEGDKNLVFVFRRRPRKVLWREFKYPKDSKRTLVREGRG